jgi:outer membrane protein assembly factor BamB
MYCKSVVAFDPPRPYSPPAYPQVAPPNAWQPRASGASGVVIAVISLGVALGVVGAIVAAVAGSAGGSSSRGGVFGASTQWEGVHGAILADVNHDGTADLIGRIRTVVPKDQIWLAAFDGRDGAELWKTAVLGTYIDTYQGALALAGDTLLFAAPGGALSGFSLRDGKRAWQSSLPEKAAQFCAGAAGTVRIVLANHNEATVGLADGHAAPPAKGGPEGCRDLPHDGKWGDPSSGVVEEHTMGSDVPGLRAAFSLQRPGGPKVLFGVRSEGTSVPTIAAVYPNDSSRTWKSDLAGSRPLETGPFGPEAAAVTDAAAYTVYAWSDIQKPKVLVAFNLSGQRQWEAPLPNTAPLTAVQASGRHVYVSQWGRLQAYDAASGKKLFSIGSGFP